MHELSVFCDESGDFGPYSSHAPLYLISLVFHNQNYSLEKQLAALNQSLRTAGFQEQEAIHTAPLIRREDRYINLDIQKRKKIFDKLFTFTRICDIQYKTIIIPKKEFGYGAILANKIEKELRSFLRSNLAFFQSYDKVILYYDRGQREVLRNLVTAFTDELSNVEIRIVHPDEYRLFQVADLTCTMELINYKRELKRMSASEKDFFTSPRNFYRTYMRYLEQKRFSS